MKLVLKMSSLFQSQMSWSTTRVGSNRCLSRMDFQDIIKSRYFLTMRSIHLQDTIRGVLIYYHVLWIKEGGATYQKAMNAIFHEHIRKTAECYIDDIAVKSRAKGDHIVDLKTVFDIMRAHQLKMNPTKSFLQVARGKLLRFVVTSKWIHLDSKKVRAIQEMQSPKNLRQLEDYKGD